MESIIIGTAGHVDHGKSVLIKALTGVDTDRLQEEKERGISIVLGFAAFSLSDGRMAGIVDVPGHEKFIHNMLAGAGGMDLVLLVVDASEGVMPQTREHLGIMELLGVQKGMVVMTKTDLVEEEWCDLVSEEIGEEIRGTFLEKAPLYRVSAVSGAGMEELKEALNELAGEVIPRDAGAPFRFPVDRSFIIPGFGTVVTGTLVQGTVKVGEIVEVLPSGEEARIRNLQVFSRDVETAAAGHRVAINLSGIERIDTERGSVVCRPGYFSLTNTFDATLKMLPSAPRKLQYLDPVHLYIGTSRVVARAALLDREELSAGEKGMVQLRLDAPVVAERKDRFIVRSYSPMTTIAGGIVLDPLPGQRHRRFRDKILSNLQELEKSLHLTVGQDYAFVWQKMGKMKFADLSMLEKNTRLSMDTLTKVIAAMMEEGKMVKLADAYVVREEYDRWASEVDTLLNNYHRKKPLSAGLSRAQLKSTVAPGLPYKDYDEFLAQLQEKGQIDADGDRVRVAGFAPVLMGKDKQVAEKILEIIEKARFQPPAPEKIAGQEKINPEQLENILQFLVKNKELVRISEDMYLTAALFKEAVETLKKHFAGNERMTMAQFRDYLQSSRKYAQLLLEHFDEKRITRRIEDYRIMLKKSGF